MCSYKFSFHSIVPYSPLKHGTDVVFLLDASRGVSRDDYRREKEFIKSLSSNFNLNPNGARGSVVVYGERPSVVVGFDDTKFSNKLDAVPLLRTQRRADKALELATRVLSTSKPDDRKIVVLLIAGSQAPGSKLFSESVKPLRKLGAQRFVVVIGRRPRDRFLLPLVDRPQDIIRVPASNGLFPRSRQISVQIRDKPGKKKQYRKGSNTFVFVQ